MIRIAICDDEAHIVRLLHGRIAALMEGREAQIEAFLSGTALRDSVLSGAQYDVLFLDINLPDVNGIFLAKHMRPFLRDSLLIFVTSQDDAVYDSFAASPFRFLRKSRLDAELPQIVRDVLKELEKTAPAGILLQYRQAQISVNPLKVIYIESNLKSQTIHMTDSALEVNYRLKELEPLFAPFGFVKPHNSYLVNYRFIASIRKNDLILDNGQSLPISKHRLAELKKAYLTLISEG